MIIHDVADPIMEFAKMCIYARRQRMADVFFAIFAAVFILSRDVIFPMYLIIPAW